MVRFHERPGVIRAVEKSGVNLRKLGLTRDALEKHAGDALLVETESRVAEGRGIEGRGISEARKRAFAKREQLMRGAIGARKYRAFRAALVREFMKH